jgi:hypothetical protein
VADGLIEKGKLPNVGRRQLQGLLGIGLSNSILLTEDYQLLAAQIPDLWERRTLS